MVERQASDAFNWPTLIAATTLGLALVGGFWMVVQTQFTYIEQDKRIIRQDLERAQSLVQVQLKDVVQRNEFAQFEARILADLDTIKKQLQLLEQTRPTTGELSGTAKALEARITGQEERVRGLELRLIPQSPPAK